MKLLLIGLLSFSALGMEAPIVRKTHSDSQYTYFNYRRGYITVTQKVDHTGSVKEYSGYLLPLYGECTLPLNPEAAKLAFIEIFNLISAEKQLQQNRAARSKMSLETSQGA